MQSGVPSENVLEKMMADTTAIAFLSGGSMSFHLSTDSAGIVVIQPIQPSILLETESLTLKKTGRDRGSDLLRTSLLILNVTNIAPASMNSIPELSRSIQVVNASRSSVLETLASLIDRIYLDSEASSTDTPIAVQNSLGASLLSIMRDFSQKLADKAGFLRYSNVPIIRFYSSESMRLNLEHLITSYREQGPSSLNHEQVAAFARLFMSNVSRVLGEISSLEDLSFKDFDRLDEYITSLTNSSHKGAAYSLACSVHEILSLFEIHVYSLVYGYEALLADIHETLPHIEVARVILAELVEQFAVSSLPRVNELISRYNGIETKVLYYRELAGLIEHFRPLIDIAPDALASWQVFKQLDTTSTKLKELQAFSAPEKSVYLHFVHFYVTYHFIRLLWSTIRASNPLETSFLFGIGSISQGLISELAGIKAIEKYTSLTFKLAAYTPPHELADADMLVDFSARLIALSGALVDIQRLQEHVQLLCASVPHVPVLLLDHLSNVLRLARAHELSFVAQPNHNHEEIPDCSSQYLQQLSHLFVHSFIHPKAPSRDLFPNSPAIATVLRGLTSIPGLLASMSNYEETYKTVLDGLFSTSNIHTFITRYGEHFSRFAIIASLQPGTKSYYNALIVKFTNELSRTLSLTEQNMYSQIRTQREHAEAGELLICEMVRYCGKAVTTGENSHLQNLQVDDVRDAVSTLLIRDAILPNLLDASLFLFARTRIVFSVEFLGVLLTRSSAIKTDSLSSISKISTILAANLNTFSSKYSKWIEFWAELLLSSFYCPDTGLEPSYLSQFLCEHTLSFERDIASHQDSPTYQANLFTFSRLPKTLHLLATDQALEISSPPDLLVIAPVPSLFNAQGLCSSFAVAGRLPSSSRVLHSSVMQRYQPLFSAILGILLPALKKYSQVTGHLAIWMGATGSTKKIMDNQSLSYTLSAYVSRIHNIIERLSIFGEICPNYVKFHSLNDMYSRESHPKTSPFYEVLFSPHFLSLPLQLIHVDNDFSMTYATHTNSQCDSNVHQDNLPEKGTIEAYTAILSNQFRELYRSVIQFDVAFASIVSEAEVVREIISELITAKQASIAKVLDKLRYSLNRLDANSTSPTELASQRHSDSGRQAIHYSLSVLISRIMTTRLIYALLILKEHFLGDSNALQRCQSLLTDTDYHHFRATKYSLFPFVANTCKPLIVSLDDTLMHTESREARALTIVKSPDFLSIVETITTGIIGHELPVDPSALYLFPEAATSSPGPDAASPGVLANSQCLPKARPLSIESFSRMIFAIQPDSLHSNELRLHYNVGLMIHLLSDIRTEAIRSSTSLTKRLVRVYTCMDVWILDKVEGFVNSHSAGASPIRSWLHVRDLVDKDFQSMYSFLSNDDTKESFLNLTELSVSENFKNTFYNRYKAFQNSILAKVTKCTLTLVGHLTRLLSQLSTELWDITGPRSNACTESDWSDSVVTLKCLAHSVDADKLYLQHKDLFPRLRTELILTADERSMMDTLIDNIYPTFAERYSHLKVQVLEDKASSTKILAHLQTTENLFRESSIVNIAKVTDSSLMCSGILSFNGSFDLDALTQTVQGVRQRLVDLQKDLTDILEVAVSMSTLFGISVSTCTDADMEALVMATDVVDSIYLPLCRELNQLFDGLKRGELSSSVLDCDSAAIDTALSTFSHKVERLSEDYLKLRGIFQDNQRVVKWLEQNSASWEKPSKLTTSLLAHAHTLTTLRPYLVQLCNPTSFHPSHWPELLAELRLVCNTQANFPPALNLQARLQTYTVYEFLGHLLLFLGLSHQSLASQEGTSSDPDAAAQVHDREPLKVLTSICESILSQARARSSVYSMVNSYTLLSKSIPLVFVHRNDICIVNNFADVVKNLESALLNISDLSTTPFYTEFSSQLLTLQETFVLYLAAVRALADVQAEYIQLSSVLTQNMSVIKRYIKDAMLKYETAVTELISVYSHLSDVPSKGTTDNLVHFFSFLGGVETCTSKILAIKDSLQYTARSLAAFIEQQRYISPRLFFLTDDNILNVITALSSLLTPNCSGHSADCQTADAPASKNDICMLEKHLSTIFPGFAHFIFAVNNDLYHRPETGKNDDLIEPSLTDSQSLIVGIVSPEGERLHLESPQCFSINSLLLSSSTEIAIHPFLLKLETSIRLSIYEQILHCRHTLLTFMNDSVDISSSQIPRLLDSQTCQAFIVGLQLVITEILDLHIDDPAKGDLDRVDAVLDELLTYIQRTYKGMYKIHCLLPELVFLQSVVALERTQGQTGEKRLDRFFKMKYYVSSEPFRSLVLKPSPWQKIYDCPILVRALSYSHVYSCNYIGSSPRLVQTELTNSHYTQSLIGIGSQFFISPVGPAGTGKTESTRQLSAHLGRPCFVFNCDEAFDYASVVRIMIGALLLGCVVCFDEFNRLTVDNLSSISLIVDAIQGLLSKEDSHRRVFETKNEAFIDASSHELQKAANSFMAQFSSSSQKYDLSRLSQLREFACFITMNPSYKGRRALPKNISALFRIVAMSQAEIETIVEVLLISLGFTSGRALSQLVCRFYQRLEAIVTHTQLDDQQAPESSFCFAHDLGLRSIRMALHAGQLFIEEEPSLAHVLLSGTLAAREAAERYILATGIRRTILPTLSHHDIPQFNDLITSIFGSFETTIQAQLGKDHSKTWQTVIPDSSKHRHTLKLLESVSPDDLLKGFVLQTTLQMGLIPCQTFIDKVLHFHMCICLSTGTIIAGASSTGKSAVQQVYYRARRALASFLSDLTGVSHRALVTYTMSPTALQTKSKFLGSLLEPAREWIDSSFLKALREAIALSEDVDSNQSCPFGRWPSLFFQFDCDIDPDWIEAFNSVLDGNRCLTLCTGERIRIPDSVRFIFESSTLRHATLATISRCSVSVHHPGTVPISDLAYGCLKRQLIIDNPHTSRFLSLLLETGRFGRTEQPQTQTRTRTRTWLPSKANLSNPATNLHTQTYVLACLNAVAFDIFSALLFASTPVHVTFHQSFVGCNGLIDQLSTAQQAPSGTATVHKTGTLGRLFRTGKSISPENEEATEGILKDILTDINTSSTSLSGTISELLNHAKSLCKQHSPISFSATRVIMTLITMLRATVAELEKYFRTRMSRIDLGLAEARLSLRTMDLQKLVSPQMVSRVLSLSGISYSTLVLFYVRRFIFSLAWSLGCQLPLSERHSLSNLVCKCYVEYLDQPSNTTSTTALTHSTSIDAQNIDDFEDLQFDLLTITYFNTKLSAPEVFAGFSLATSAHSAPDVSGLNAPSSLWLSTTAPQPLAHHSCEGDNSTLSNQSVQPSLLSYVCSIDSEYWQLNDPEDSGLRRSFVSTTHDSMSMLMESSLTMNARRARFEESSTANNRVTHPLHNGASKATFAGPQLVPNIDTQSYTMYISSLVDQGRHVLLMGPAGSGKTVLLTHILNQDPNLRVIFTSFSSQTSPSDLISILFNHFDVVPEDDHYTLVSPTQQALCLIIDEINLVDKDSFDAQPAIEFLRFLLEYRYFVYDGVLPESKDKKKSGTHGTKETPVETSTIITLPCNVIIACSCNPPTDAGRSLLSERFMKQVSTLYLDHPSHAALLSIYTAYTSDMLAEVLAESNLLSSLDPDTATALSTSLASSMITAYERIAAAADQKQSSSVHSPRDLTRWITSIKDHYRSYQLTDAAGVFSCQMLAQLILYEGSAVFSTKLMTQQEKTATIAVLTESLHGFLETFSKALGLRSAGNPTLELSTFNTLLLQKNFKLNLTSGLSLTGLDTFLASTLTEQEAWSNIRHLFSKYYNKSASMLTLAHVQFVSDSIYHIVRTLNTPHGHLIISAEPGVFVAPLLQFIAWLSESNIFELRTVKRYSLMDFQKFVRGAIEAAVTKPENVLIVISYENGLSVNFLEHLNNLLCNGDVTGFLTKPQLHKIMSLTNLSDLDQLQQLVKQKLHMLFTVSSTLEDSNIILSPALYNRCQLISISGMPIHSLVLKGTEHTQSLVFPKSVSECIKNVTDVELEHRPDAELRDWISTETQQLIDILKQQQDDSVLEIQDTLTIAAPGLGPQQRLSAALALLHERTPTVVQQHHDVVGFLSLPEVLRNNPVMRSMTFHSLLQYERLCERFARSYLQAYEDFCSQQSHLVKGLEILDVVQTRVSELQAELHIKKERLAEMTTITQEKLAEVTKLREIAMASKAESVKLSTEITQKHEYIQARMESVQSELAEAEPALLAARGSIRTISKTALEEIRRMARPAEAITLVMAAVIIIISPTISNINTSWEAVRKIMQRNNFQSSILMYNPAEDEHAAYRLERLTEYQSNPTFKRDIVNHASQPAGLLFDWIMSIYGFLKIKAKVQPLEQALLQIKEEASGLEARRAEIMIELVEMENNIDSLTTECSECEAQQIKLQSQKDECESNTKQATIITELLSNEIKRWSEQQADSEHALANIMGDMLLEAFYETYAGSYTDNLRIELATFAEEVLEALSISCTKDKALSLRSMLSNYSLIERVRSPKTPILLFDYTKGDLDHLRTIYKKHITISALADDLMASVERAMKFGFTLIIEDGDSLDPALFVLHRIVEESPVLAQSPPSEARRLFTVELAGAIVPVHPEFSAIVLCQTVGRAIHFAAKCSVINFAHSDEKIVEILCGHIIKYLNPDLYSAQEKVESDLAMHAKTIVSLEKELLGALNTVDHNSILTNTNLISHLQATKAQYKQINMQIETLKHQKKDYDVFREELHDGATTLSRIFSVLRRMRDLETGFLFTLEQMLFILDATLEKYKALSGRNYSDLIVIFIELCYNNILASLTLTARNAVRKFLEEIATLEASKAVTCNHLELRSHATFADYYVFYKKHTHCMLLNIVEDTDPKTVVQTVVQNVKVDAGRGPLVHSIPFGVPEAHISKIAGILKSAREYDIMLLTNMHLASASYCEDLCKVIQSYLKTHSINVSIVISIQGTDDNSLTEEIRSLASSLGCISFLSQKELSPVALYEQARLDARQVAAEQVSNIPGIATLCAETGVEPKIQQTGQIINSEFESLLDKLTYTYVVFRLRASMKPYGFAGNYSFTSVDLRYAIDLLVKEFSARLTESDTSFHSLVNHFSKKLLREICFGNGISTTHDKVIAERLIDNIFGMDTLPKMVESCTGVFLNEALDEIMIAARQKQVDDMYQLILGRAGYGNAGNLGGGSHLATSVVSAVISKLLGVRKSLQQEEKVGTNSVFSDRWSLLSSAIFNVKCAARATLLVYMHAAEKGSAALDALQSSLGEDALQHVSFLADQYQYCTDVLETMQTGKTDSLTFIPPKLGASTYQCFSALFQDLLGQIGTDSSESGEMIACFTTTPTSNAVPVPVKSFLFVTDGDIIQRSPNGGIVTLFLTLAPSANVIHSAGLPVFLDSSRDTFLGFAQDVGDTDMIWDGSAFYFL